MANTSKGVPFLPPSDVCQKLSLSPLYFNKTLLHKSSEGSSLVSGPRLNCSPLEAKNPGVFAWFSSNLSSWGLILQDKVRMLGALVLCSPSKHVFCWTFLTLRCACVNKWHTPCKESEEPCFVVPQRPHMAYGRNLSGVYTDLPMPRGTQWDQPEMGKACGLNSPFLVKLFGLFDHFITPWN